MEDATLYTLQEIPLYCCLVETNTPIRNAALAETLGES
jgi:hypothetical protein